MDFNVHLSIDIIIDLLADCGRTFCRMFKYYLVIESEMESGYKKFDSLILTNVLVTA